MRNAAVTQAPECAICPMSTAPNFILQDLNPSSCGIGQFYGLDAFQGKVTFIVLLRSTCGYCHGQLEKLEQMRFELLLAGHDLHMLVINEKGTGEYINLLTMRTQIPILQDVSSVDAWRALSHSEIIDGNLRITGGDKDDMYIYNPDGTLYRFLDDANTEFSLNLSTDIGYQNLKGALIEALQAANEE
jgi:hypothetical protein